MSTPARQSGPQRAPDDVLEHLRRARELSDDLIAAMTRAQAEGGLPGVGLTVDDCRKTFEDLKAKGVEFLQEPEERAPYGVEALMRDNSGNWKVIVEPRDYSPSDFEGFEGFDPEQVG